MQPAPGACARGWDHACFRCFSALSAFSAFSAVNPSHDGLIVIVIV